MNFPTFRCPCERWQLEVSREAIRDYDEGRLLFFVGSAIAEHRNDCIVLAATHLTNRAAAAREA